MKRFLGVLVVVGVLTVAHAAEVLVIPPAGSADAVAVAEPVLIEAPAETPVPAANNALFKWILGIIIGMAPGFGAFLVVQLKSSKYRKHVEGGITALFEGSEAVQAGAVWLKTPHVDNFKTMVDEFKDVKIVRK